MSRRLLILNGLAILAVVLNHAVGWGFTAMFWWTDRYRPVSVPNWDQMGSLAYYVLLVIKQLTVFSVPAFLFVSGFFIAYAVRGSASALNWKMVRARLTNLLVPYAIWTSVIFIGDWIERVPHTPADYLTRLLTGDAVPAYFYVPIICQLYLLSLWIAAIARIQPKWLLIGSAAIQLARVILLYLTVWGMPGLPQILKVIPTLDWLFIGWIFYFSLGVVSGLCLTQLKQWLAQVKWALLVALIAMTTLAVIEPEFIYRSTGNDWRGGVHTLSTSLYAVLFILCFVAFEQVPIPFSKFLSQLGGRTYGIYLLHPKLLELVARIIAKFAPMMLAYQVPLLLILAIPAVGLAILFMDVIARSPVRKAYSYLFG